MYLIRINGEGMGQVAQTADAGIRDHIGEMVCRAVSEIMNALPERERATRACGPARRDRPLNVPTGCEIPVMWSSVFKIFSVRFADVCDGCINSRQMFSQNRDQACFVLAFQETIDFYMIKIHVLKFSSSRKR